MRIDTTFKLYLIKEFERLKYNEAYKNKIEQKIRLEKLNNIARRELKILSNDKNIIGINNKETMLNLEDSTELLTNV